MLGQQAGARDVVGMGMGLDRPQQPEPVLAQHGQIALELAVDRIDDQRLAAGFIEQQIGVGAGIGIEELDRLHGGGRESGGPDRIDPTS